MLGPTTQFHIRERGAGTQRGARSLGEKGNPVTLRATRARTESTYRPLGSTTEIGWEYRA